MEDWEGPLSFALWCQRASPWWIGDMVNIGDERFGEVFYQLCEGYGISTDMIQRYKSVSRRVPPSNRRPSLSWSAHAVVARLPMDQQKAALDEAERRGWTSDELRRYLQKQAAHPKGIDSDTPASEESHD